MKDKINWQDIEIPSHRVISVKDDPETGGKIVHADLEMVFNKAFEICMNTLIKDAKNHAEYSEKEEDNTFWMMAEEWIKQAKNYLKSLDK